MAPGSVGLFSESGSAWRVIIRFFVAFLNWFALARAPESVRGPYEPEANRLCPSYGGARREFDGSAELDTS